MGQEQSLTVDPKPSTGAPGYSYFVNQEDSSYPLNWSIAGTYVKFYNLSVAYGSFSGYQALGPSDYASASPDFYWIAAGSPSGDPVAVNVLLERTDENEEAYVSANALYEAATPIVTEKKAPIIRSVILQPTPLAIHPSPDPDAFGLGMPVENHEGFEYSFSATSPNGVTGVITSTQIIQDLIQYTPDSSNLFHGTNYAPELDTCFMYDDPVATGGTLYETSDSPLQPMGYASSGEFTAVSRSDYFNTLFLYLPEPRVNPTRKSIWIPLYQIGWNWSGNVSLNSRKAWQLNQPVSEITSSTETSTFLNWTAVVSPQDQFCPLPPSQTTPWST